VGLKAELETEVNAIFSAAWDERDGTAVPTDTSLTLNKNVASKIEATVLYADLADSTKLVDAYDSKFAAEIYKTYLKCAAKIINAEGGSITAYDGDRVMAVYIGNPKNTPAVKTGLKIAYAVQEIITPGIKRQYPHNTYVPRCVVGIDTSTLFVARTGVRDANDLVWVGRAANYAAKLTALPDAYSVYITQEVFDGMKDEVKFSNGTPMWQSVRWNTFDNRTIYRTTYRWRID
jgi:class 3 adenylate cyclase